MLDDPCGGDHAEGSEAGAAEGRIKGKRRRFFQATGLQTGLSPLEGKLNALGTGRRTRADADGYVTPGEGKAGQTRSWLAGLTNGNGDVLGYGNGAAPVGRSALSGSGPGMGNANGNGTVVEWNAVTQAASRAASPMSVL